MTDTDQKLCRDIAEAEGWRLSPYVDKHGRPSGYRGANLDREPLPAYLTDPAEMVRMLKALADWGVVHLLKIDDQDTWMCGISYKDIHHTVTRHNFEGPSAEHAVAEAFKAMLLAKRGKERA